MLASLQASIGKAVRVGGAALEKLGRTLEVNPNVDRLQPSLRVVKLGKSVPATKDGVFVAPTASVIGNVTIGSDTSVWYGAVIRGDVNSITIGDNCSIGDRAMVHCSGITVNKPTLIGNRVVIGVGAIVHGCTLEDETLVGEGAQVLDGARVAKHAMVAPGAVVGQGKVVTSGQLWAGVPAVYVRDLNAAEKASIAATANSNSQWAIKHAVEDAKNWRQVAAELDDYEQMVGRNEVSSFWCGDMNFQMSTTESPRPHHFYQLFFFSPT